MKFNKQAKVAIQHFNNGIKTTPTPKTELNLSLSGNGIGLRFQF